VEADAPESEAQAQKPKRQRRTTAKDRQIRTTRECKDIMDSMGEKMAGTGGLS